VTQQADTTGATEGEGIFRLPVLAPETPIFAWLAAREEAAWPALAVLDLAHAPLQAPGLRALVQAMAERGVRVVGLAGLDPARLGDQPGQFPPLLPAPALASGAAAPAATTTPAALAPSAPAPAPESLVIEGNLRSGQSVRHLAGDVSVIGTVASGAEIVAGGSVHVYGALRGRASAGQGGGPAQIFCQHLAAELLAINGVLLLAEDMDPALLGRPARAARAGDALRLHPLV
jgi:septum site-determining protein MinC